VENKGAHCCLLATYGENRTFLGIYRGRSD